MAVAGSPGGHALHHGLSDPDGDPLTIVSGLVRPRHEQGTFGSPSRARPPPGPLPEAGGGTWSISPSRSVSPTGTIPPKCDRSRSPYTPTYASHVQAMHRDAKRDELATTGRRRTDICRGEPRAAPWVRRQGRDLQQQYQSRRVSIVAIDSDLASSPSPPQAPPPHLHQEPGLIIERIGTSLQLKLPRGGGMSAIQVSPLLVAMAPRHLPHQSALHCSVLTVATTTAATQTLPPPPHPAHLQTRPRHNQHGRRTCHGRDSHRRPLPCERGLPVYL